MSKKKVITIALALVLLISVIGLTYAYFAINQSNTSSSLSIETGALKLVLEDGTDEHGIISGEISANNTKFVTYLSITNEGTYDTFAKLYFKGLTNTFSEYLVYSVEQIDAVPVDNTEPKIVKRFKYQVPVPASSVPTRELLADGLLIKMGTLSGNNLTPNTEYYRVTIEYLYSDTENQNEDLNKSFYTGFDIEQGDKLNETIVMIDNIEDLVELAKEVNSGDSKSGKEYRLMRNLDFNSNDSYLDPTTTKYGDINKNNTVEPLKTELTTSAGWVPIGTSTNSYSGTFNGQNNEIKNLYINNSDSNLTNLGLFGYTNSSILRNLGLVNVNIYSNTNANIGGIIGTALNTEINSCYNTVTTINNSVYNIDSINGNSIGGLIGYSNSGSVTINNSYNNANIRGGNHIGGIAGLLNNVQSVSINNVINNGLVVGNMYNVAGIIGRISANSIIIDNALNNGTISGDGENLAGISGNIITPNGTIKNTKNNGTITGGFYTAGILSLINSSERIIIDKCYNTGTISSSASSNFSGTMIAGIIGTAWNNKNIYILNSLNSGNINTLNNLNSNSFNAGIVGSVGAESAAFNSNMYLVNSYNSGDLQTVKSETITGIIGCASNYQTITINNVYNIGSLSGTSNSMYNIAVISANSTGTAINIYHQSNKNASNKSTINNNSIIMSLSDMKASSFIGTLNGNIGNITLPNELNGYTLSTWCTSDNGPVFDYEVPASERTSRCPAYNS